MSETLIRSLERPEETLILNFGSPQDGWLRVVLKGRNYESTFDASDVPGDSLLMLATGVCDLLAKRSAEARVLWFLEPTEIKWVFRRSGEEVLVIAETDEVSNLVETESCHNFGRCIWRALTTLRDDPGWQLTKGREAQWSNTFPNNETAQLARLIEDLRASE